MAPHTLRSDSGDQNREPPVFDPAFILVRPQIGENIGAAARALANFSLRDLRIVAPRDGWPNERAEAVASRAFDYVTPQIFPDLASATADLHCVAATTGRRRELQKEVLDLDPALSRIETFLARGAKTGILFGPERSGLETNEIASCQILLTLPVNPDFPSLNLAQSLAIIAHGWARHSPDRRARRNSQAIEQEFIPASQAEMAGLFAQLEGELAAAGFFHPPEKRLTMERNLRASLSRAGFSEGEVRTWRGVIKALVYGRGQQGRRGDPRPRSLDETEADAP